jgi:hypothetical protein
LAGKLPLPLPPLEGADEDPDLTLRNQVHAVDFEFWPGCLRCHPHLFLLVEAEEVILPHVLIHAGSEAV